MRVRLESREELLISQILESAKARRCRCASPLAITLSVHTGARGISAANVTGVFRQFAAGSDRQAMVTIDAGAELKAALQASAVDRLKLIEDDPDFQ